MGTRKATTRTSAAAPVIDPEAEYRVHVKRRFRFQEIGFGPLCETRVRGELLTRLLASEHKDSVDRFERTDA